MGDETQRWGKGAWYLLFWIFEDKDARVILSTINNMVDNMDARQRCWLDDFFLGVLSRFLHNQTTNYYHMRRQLKLNIWVVWFQLFFIGIFLKTHPSVDPNQIFYLKLLIPLTEKRMRKCHALNHEHKHWRYQPLDWHQPTPLPGFVDHFNRKRRSKLDAWTRLVILTHPPVTLAHWKIWCHPSVQLTVHEFNHICFFSLTFFKLFNQGFCKINLFFNLSLMSSPKFLNSSPYITYRMLLIKTEPG